MANTVVNLRDGLKIGEVKHIDVEIREATAGDLVEAAVESEKLIHVPGEGSLLVTSPTLIGANTIRRQIVRVGDYKGPLSLAELKLFSAY
jgi:phage FluMu protein gp41